VYECVHVYVCTDGTDDIHRYRYSYTQVHLHTGTPTHRYIYIQVHLHGDLPRPWLGRDGEKVGAEGGRIELGTASVNTHC